MALVVGCSNRRTLLVSRGFDELDTLADSDDELLLLTDLLSRTRPMASPVAPQVIDLTINFSNGVSQLHKLLSIVGR
jgi:hypothetical protein